MQTIFNDYFDDINKHEQSKIREKLRNVQYVRLEISLKFPYGYR